LTDPAQTGRALLAVARAGQRVEVKPEQGHPRIPVRQPEEKPASAASGVQDRPIYGIEIEAASKHQEIPVQCTEPPHAIFDLVELFVFRAFHRRSDYLPRAVVG